MPSILWSCIMFAGSGLSYTDLESLESRETASPGMRVLTVGALDAQPEIFTYTTQGRPVYPLIPSATENTANSPTSAFVSTSPLNLAAHHEASSLPSYASCAPFPSMYRGMNAIEWDSKGNEWSAAQQEISGDHIKYWADCMPVVRLPELMYDLEIDNLLNEKQVFTKSGFINGEAIWFKEIANRTREDPVVFYLHGGSYLWGLMPNHIQAVNSLNNLVNSSRLSWLVIDHTLANVKKLSQELNETVTAYNLLANSTDNIIILTDSSGAHLGIELLIHMQQALTDVADVVSKKPYAIAMSSPWMDYLDDTSIIWEYVVGTADKSDYLWQPPIYSPGQVIGLNWTAILPSKIYVTYGENEPYRDWVEDFIEHAGLTGDQVYMQPNGNHDEMVTEGNLNMQEKFASFLDRVINDLPSNPPVLYSTSTNRVTPFTTG